MRHGGQDDVRGVIADGNAAYHSGGQSTGVNQTCETEKERDPVQDSNFMR